GANVDAVAGTRALDTCHELGAQQVWDHLGASNRLGSSHDYDAIVMAAGRPNDWFGALRSRGRMALTDGAAWLASIPAAVCRQIRAVPVAAGHASADLTWPGRKGRQARASTHCRLSPRPSRH